MWLMLSLGGEGRGEDGRSSIFGFMGRTVVQPSLDSWTEDPGNRENLQNESRRLFFGLDFFTNLYNYATGFRCATNARLILFT
jgi:hypothetical protein